MKPSQPHGPVPEEAVFSVPGMTCRHCVRAISTHVRDVTGVVAIEADTTTRTVRVSGHADPAAIRAAIAAAGHESGPDPTGGDRS